MNNLPNDRSRLLADTLDGDWATGPAAAMARRAAAHARRRRAVKHASLLLAAAGVVVALLLSPRAPAPAARSSPPIASAPATSHPDYAIISDEELIATLRDRPLLVLPQENGTKKIVLLDR